MAGKRTYYWTRSSWQFLDWFDSLFCCFGEFIAKAPESEAEDGFTVAQISGGGVAIQVANLSERSKKC
jgi:hypothetical protein